MVVIAKWNVRALKSIKSFFKSSYIANRAGHKFEKNEMGGACSTYGGGERYV
jgi:hypothetical protein